MPTLTAFEAQPQVGIQLLLQAGPHARGLHEQAVAGSEKRQAVFCPRVLEILKAVVRGVDLNVQRARIGARRLAVERAAFDEQDVEAATGQVVGGSTTEDAAADDQHIRAAVHAASILVS